MTSALSHQMTILTLSCCKILTAAAASQIKIRHYRSRETLWAARPVALRDWTSKAPPLRLTCTKNPTDNTPTIGGRPTTLWSVTWVPTLSSTVALAVAPQWGSSHTSTCRRTPPIRAHDCITKLIQPSKERTRLSSSSQCLASRISLDITRKET
jgi:hypothetical protein